MKFILMLIITMGGQDARTTVSSAGEFKSLAACETAKVETLKRTRPYHEIMGNSKWCKNGCAYQMPSVYIDASQAFCTPADTEAKP